MIVKIKGKKRDLRFSLGAQIIYEEITNKPFSVENLKYTRDRLTLAFACMKRPDEKDNIEFDDLLKVDAKTFNEIDAALAKELTAWYNIPTVAGVAKDTAPEDEVGKKKG